MLPSTVARQNPVINKGVIISASVAVFIVSVFVIVLILVIGEGDNSQSNTDTIQSSGNGTANATSPTPMSPQSETRAVSRSETSNSSPLAIAPTTDPSYHECICNNDLKPTGSIMTTGQARGQSYDIGRFVIVFLHLL